jgi:hypothetical protein
MSVHPTIERYVDEPGHLLTMREDEPLHIPSELEFFQATGRRLIAEDYYHYFENTPFNLTSGSGPAVLGGFTWSNLWVDNMANADLTQYFTTPQIIGDETVYNSWRVRGMWRGGYLLAYYATIPNPGFTPSMNAMIQGNQGFQRIGNGFALGLGGGNLIVRVGNQYFFNGGNQDIYFPIKFQIEVGYGDPNYAAADPAANLNWPAFTAGIGTDLLGYRGYNPNWACFNGYANAPNVIALGGCPYTGQGGYVPPDPPEDL